MSRNGKARVGAVRSRRQAAVRQQQEWFRIRNFTDQPNRAAVYLFDEIGYWGTSAADFVQQLNALNVDFLDVHINSPGGEVDDGIAIFNALRQHRAHVTVYIDGLAASAASFIACAGDEVCISEFAQVMIHDAMGIEFGNAAEMRAFADILDRYSDNIAAIYAQQSGRSTEECREAMRVETWYTGAEAVTAGLADRVYDLMVPEEDADLMVASRWDLSLYAYRFQGRAAAPAPPLNTAEPSQPDDTAPVLAGDTEQDTAAVPVPAVSHANEGAVGQVDSDPEDPVVPDTDVPEVETDTAGTDAVNETEPEPDTTPVSDSGVVAAPAPESDPEPWAQLTARLTAPSSSPVDEFARLTEALKGA